MHSDATRFWQEVTLMLRLANCDRNMAFCAGACAAAALTHGLYPSREDMETAATMGPRAYMESLGAQ